jgi:hypothetical protein
MSDAALGAGNGRRLNAEHLTTDPANGDNMTSSRAYNLRHFPQQVNLCIDGVWPTIAEHFGTVAALQYKTVGGRREGINERGEVGGFRR